MRVATLSGHGGGAPAAGGGFEGGFVVGPVVQGRGIEIGAGGPDNSVDLAVENRLGENGGVAQRAEEFAFEDWLEVDDSYRLIAKANAEGVRPDALEGIYSMERVRHTAFIAMERPQRNGAIGAGSRVCGRVRGGWEERN